MGLRLLCETAAKSDNGKNIIPYIKTYFSAAKTSLDKDAKTTLANQNVTEESIQQLLHTGAHSYQSSTMVDQTIALSIILGAMLTLSHGK